MSEESPFLNILWSANVMIKVLKYFFNSLGELLMSELLDFQIFFDYLEKIWYW